MTTSLRSQPYPFSSMLAICSDLDETPDASTYFETITFLNSDQQTSMGKGINLEIGNTIYFKMPQDQFSYFNASDKDREKIHLLIKSGHIDCIHSFGDLVKNRREISDIWKILEVNHCKPKVWIDHAQACSNFDSDIMLGEGATPSSPCYHADISLENGIKFIWKGRVTSIVSQNRPISFRAIYDSSQKFGSCLTILKEALKVLFAWSGSRKYAMHAKNKIYRQTKLKSGQEVFEFIRSNPSWAGVSEYETADGIDKVLSKKILEQLVRTNGTTIIYTHLGKTDSDNFLPSSAVNAFRLLAKYNQKRKILVTTTCRLLEYNLTTQTVEWESSQEGEVLTISLKSKHLYSELQGLCWYVADNVSKAKLVIDKSDSIALTVNAPDSKGKKSVSFPWSSLKLPD